MKQFILICGLLYTIQLSAQVVDIPDANFLEALIEEGVDINGDGMIQESEAFAVDSLDVGEQSIIELSGVEYFLNLEYLNCSRNNLNVLDISELANLRYLDCGRNDFSSESIDVSQNLNLDTLMCYFNNLSTLDVSQNLNLEYLDCELNNLMTLKTPQNLKYLDCGKNELGILDLSQSVSLEYLDCNRNALEVLDVSQFINLTYLDCSRNKLVTLDISENLNLESLDCSGDFDFSIDTLDISQNLNLVSLICENIQLDTLDISQHFNLESLDCRSNNLMFIDLSKNLKLKRFTCFSNNFESLDVRQNLNLEGLFCGSNDLKDLDVSRNFKLSGLNCEFNDRLQCLDLRSNPDLRFLWSQRNSSLHSLLISSTFFQRIDLKNTDVQFICAPMNIWDDFDTAEIPNATITDQCILFTCKNYFHISGSIASSTDSCEPNVNIDYSNIKYRVNIGSDSIDILSNTLNSYLFRLPEDSINIRPVFPNSDLFIVEPSCYDFYLSEDLDSLDFCYSPSGLSKLDVSIDLYTEGSPRPGFEHEYSFTYDNLGNEISEGRIAFSFDPEQMTFLSSQDTWIVNDNELVLDYDNLIPFETRSSNLLFRLNSPMDTPPLVGGEIICSSISLIPNESDFDQSNNTVSLKETVVNSYDPNDKTCLQGEYLNIDSLSKSMTYRIRFENTGTADAINISIEDSIDVNVFDIRTARLSGASHEVQMKVEDDVLTFDFFNINLPFADELNDGYVIFSIRPWSSLTLDTELSNEASIFFDFNFPIITNTAITLVVEDIDMDGYYHFNDCDDMNPDVNPEMVEIIYNGINDDCDPLTLDDDLDQDGYGIAEDCNDSDASINPDAEDIPNNGIDEDCDGMDAVSSTSESDQIIFSISPNPVDHVLNISSDSKILSISVIDIHGKTILSLNSIGQSNYKLDLSDQSAGLLILRAELEEGFKNVRLIKN